MFNPQSEVKQYGLSLHRKGAEKTIPFPVMNILAWRENGKCYAHCLELDIAADGETEEQAANAVSELSIDQIEFAIHNHMEFYNPAPPEYWEKLKEIQVNRLRQRLMDHPPRTKEEVSLELVS